MPTSMLPRRSSAADACTESTLWRTAAAENSTMTGIESATRISMASEVCFRRNAHGKVAVPCV
jgi:hypothetical protein